MTDDGTEKFVNHTEAFRKLFEERIVETGIRDDATLETSEGVYARIYLKMFGHFMEALGNELDAETDVVDILKQFPRVFGEMLLSLIATMAHGSDRWLSLDQEQRLDIIRTQIEMTCRYIANGMWKAYQATQKSEGSVFHNFPPTVGNA